MFYLKLLRSHPPRKCHLVLEVGNLLCTVDCTLTIKCTSPYMLISESIGLFCVYVYIYVHYYITFSPLRMTNTLCMRICDIFTCIFMLCFFLKNVSITYLKLNNAIILNHIVITFKLLVFYLI